MEDDKRKGKPDPQENAGDAAEKFLKAVDECGCLLIGIGTEWETAEKGSGSGAPGGRKPKGLAGQTENGRKETENPEKNPEGPGNPENRTDRDAREARLKEAYDTLRALTAGKDYFIVTTATDGRLWESGIDRERMAAPCGNEKWRQCSRACTKDIWEPGEVPSGLCPHCGAPLVGNTVRAEQYIEEGYLPRWKAYQEWLGRTLNRGLLAVELGEGFQRPQMIRWPFEKTVFFNRKSHLYRINGTFAQVSEDIAGRADSVQENSVDFILRAGRIRRRDK